MPSSNEKVRVAQIGLGYWGPNLLRNLRNLPTVDVSTVADLNPQRLVGLDQNGPAVRTTTDVDEVFGDPTIQAVVIATPAATHFELAQRALLAGKHVLIEKPLTTSSADGAVLTALADERNLVLMVGHTFLYNAAVRRLKEVLDSGELGEVFYIYSQRLNLGRVRQDVNALWNFAPHDVSILLYLLGETPAEVSARGFACLQPGVEDVVFMTLVFQSGMGANVHLSWLDPHRVRRTTVVGSRKMAVYDDVSNDAKIVIYDRGVDRIPTSTSPTEFSDFAEFQLLPRHGDVTIPAFDFPEPLRLVCSHFVDCIRNGERPLTDGRHGLEVVKVIEAAQRSMAKGGVPKRVGE